MKRILITGASGGVAGMIRPILRQEYRLRLSDRRPVEGALPEEEVVPADLGDIEAVRRAVAGTDGIVHLGGQSVETGWETVLSSNIVGAYNLFEAAKLEGVKRIVFASTNHVTGFYPRSERIGHEAIPRPDTRYGLSKAFGESLGGLYAYKYGAEVLSIRIGYAAPRPNDVRSLSVWVSPRDLCQLIRIGLETPGLRHEIVYGVSANKRSWWDNGNAARLGYKPRDNSEDYAAEVVARDQGKTGDDRVDLNQGGKFCAAESM